MIIKIIPPKKGETSQNFGGVRYNDNKVEKGSGELMKMKNFPLYIDKNSSQDVVANYFKSISKQNTSIKKPQFHCTISTAGREHSKQELTEIADRVMDKMGYKNQPFIIVYHSDTSNNHVHIVSTRVDKDDGTKINDSFENLRSQTALREVLKEMYGIDHEKKLDKLLKYKFANESQFKKLLETYGFEVRKKEQDYTIAHHGVPLTTIKADSLKFDEATDQQRKKQLYSILNRYKDEYSNKVFKVTDEAKFSYQSELQNHLKEKFGIEIVFSYKDDKKPFGYTIIDNKTGAIFKGSEVMKMDKLFDFTTDEIEKKFFDILENYNIAEKESKQVVLDYLRNKYACDIKDYMAFENKKKVPYKLYDEARNLAVNYIRNYGQVKNDISSPVFVEHSNKFYMIHDQEKKVYDLQKLVGERYYSDFLNRDAENRSSFDLQTTSHENVVSPESHSLKDLVNLTSAFDLKGQTANEDEEQQKRKRKKRKR